MLWVSVREAELSRQAGGGGALLVPPGFFGRLDFKEPHAPPKPPKFGGRAGRSARVCGEGAGAGAQRRAGGARRVHATPWDFCTAHGVHMAACMAPQPRGGLRRAATRRGRQGQSPRPAPSQHARAFVWGVRPVSLAHQCGANWHVRPNPNSGQTRGYGIPGGCSAGTWAGDCVRRRRPSSPGGGLNEPNAVNSCHLRCWSRCCCWGSVRRLKPWDGFTSSPRSPWRGGTRKRGLEKSMDPGCNLRPTPTAGACSSARAHVHTPPPRDLAAAPRSSARRRSGPAFCARAPPK